ncbi:DsbA family oxidoreductase [Thalassobacillus hwangdonensis]|uniref:DsbA family oxidoreductase n=1 Tax=Thalassobacillus hwangdonensis TaxID=546108 RepID=A0ABW3L487_9BACI
MKIEIWSDIVCPFCYIGKRRLEAALADFEGKNQVEIEFKSFELDPGAEKNTESVMYERLASKYGTSIEQAKQMCDNMVEQAKGVGLDFRFDDVIPTNTLDAHRLTHLAKDKGVEKEVHERFFHAYFTEAKNMGDHDTLTELALDAGLDEAEVREVLASERYTDSVRKDEAEARTIGVQGVPFFVINRKYAVSGAQPVDVFKNALSKAWDEEQQQPVFETVSSDNEATGVCTDDSCDIPNDQ